MPDMDKMNQCVLLVKALWFLPAPARTKIADGLYDLGVRVHPELATKNLMALGPEGMGGHRARTIVSTNTRDNMDLIRRVCPDLAEKMAAATNPEQQAALRQEIREKYGDIIGEAEQRLAAAKPEDLG